MSDLPRDAHAFTLSGFADEIADDFETQLATLADLGIDALDLRRVDGTNVLDLDDAEIRETRRALDDAGVTVTSIGSPVGKVPIDAAFDAHLERFHDALHAADQFDADYVRVFSYYVDERDAHREEVLRRMREKAARADAAGVTLVLENEKGVYGDTPARCRDVLTAVDSPALRAAFDPANFLELGVRPYPDALLALVEYVEQLHVKDAVRGERGAMRPAGEGDGRITETLDALAERGFDGPVSLEPHLAEAGARSGRSGPDGYARAARALRARLDDADATVR